MEERGAYWMGPLNNLPNNLRYINNYLDHSLQLKQRYGDVKDPPAHIKSCLPILF